MRHILIITIFSLLFANSVFAGDLCDPDCSLVIDFPTGGSIEAVDELTITFGDAGKIDTVATLTSYVEGETLTLNAGESIDFGSGGSFELGHFGNIDFTHISISTSGVLELNTDVESENTKIDFNVFEISNDATFNINAVNSLEIKGMLQGGDFTIIANSGSIFIEAEIVASDSLVISSAGNLNLSAPLSISNGNIALSAGTSIDFYGIPYNYQNTGTLTTSLDITSTSSATILAGNGDLTLEGDNLIVLFSSPNGVYLSQSFENTNQVDSKKSSGSLSLFLLIMLAASFTVNILISRNFK